MNVLPVLRKNIIDTRYPHSMAAIHHLNLQIRFAFEQISLVKPPSFSGLQITRNALRISFLIHYKHSFTVLSMTENFFSIFYLFKCLSKIHILFLRMLFFGHSCSKSINFLSNFHRLQISSSSSFTVDLPVIRSDIQIY